MAVVQDVKELVVQQIRVETHQDEQDELLVGLVLECTQIVQLVLALVLEHLRWTYNED